MITETSNRPKDNPLYQQRLRAWTPMLTMIDACIFFIVTGIIVLIIGFVIYFTDVSVLQYKTDYTACTAAIGGRPCSANDSKISNVNCTCNVTIYVDTDMTVPIFFYYGMSNYYQNHRQFSGSLDMQQLTGSGDPDEKSCAPLIKDSSGKYYAPCGQMANAIFNDTFILSRSSDYAVVPWSSTNISMNSDRMRYGKITNWNNTVRPPSWDRSESSRSASGYVGDEELMVWLRPSPLPTFRKLHRILRQSSTSSPFSSSLPKGNYTLFVNYNYPVTSFGGQKFFIISSVSWLGGKNPALGILYLVTGCLELVVGLVLFIVWMKGRGQIEEPDTTIMNTTEF